MSKNPPNTKDLEAALLHSLRHEADGLTVKEIESRVIEILGLQPDFLEIKRADGRSEFGYRLAWARTHAKQKGLITNPRFLIWKLT